MSSILVLLAALAWSGPQPRPMLADDPLPKCGRGWDEVDRSLLAESVHSYNVLHYRLDFDLPMTNAGYTCHERVLFVSEVPGLDTMPLHFNSLVCDSVKRNGAMLDFETPLGWLNITMDSPVPQGDTALVDIFYHRDSTIFNKGYYFGRPPTTRYAHAMTCGCPFETRYWFACWDLPHDKAEQGCMINLTVPDTFQTCSNGMLDSVTGNTDGTRTFWWRHPYGIATYLMTFSASRFASWDTFHVNPGNAETIPIIHWMWPEDSAATRVGYQRLPDMFDYYTRPDMFGDYPFDRFGHVPGYYGFPWGGMEHQTLVMLHPSYIGGGRETTIAHELSHMWWGDMVTHVDHRDVWLNEGFATYAECMYVGHWQGRSQFNNYIQGKAQSAISQDRVRRFAIYDPPELYNTGTIYCKGSWVQHMLRWVVGDTAWDQPGVFFEGLRAYGDSFRYGTVSTTDYCRIMEQETGMELDWYFDEWIYLAGYPKYFLNVNRQQIGDSFRVVTTLAQSNGQQAPDFFRTPLPVRFNCLYVDTTVVIHPQANPQIDTFMLFSCPESVTVDPDNWVLDSAYVSVTGVEESGSGPLSVSRLLSVAPNPSAGRVEFTMFGPPGGDARVEVFDRTGRLVAEVLGRQGPDGRAVLDWNHDRIAPGGIYFCRAVGSGQDPVKLVLAE
jgi:aminopeptidase N